MEESRGIRGLGEDECWLSDKFIEGLVSVIIPTYNRRKYLGEALKSVHDQYARPIEVIVIDDGSTDGTAELVNQWKIENKDESNFSVRYIKQRNQGAPAARNKGLLLSRGQYIQFLDSDDVILPSKISDALRAFEEDRSLDFVYSLRGDFVDCLEDMRPWDRQLADLENDLSPAEVVISHVWTALPVFSRDVLRRGGGWDERLTSHQDSEFITRIAFWSESVKCIHSIQALCRQHQGSRISVNRWGEPTGVNANALAAAAVYPLVLECNSPRKSEALSVLAKRLLSCLRVAVASGNSCLAREISNKNKAAICVNRFARMELSGWKFILALPDSVINVIFFPIRLLKRFAVIHR